MSESVPFYQRLQDTLKPPSIPIGRIRGTICIFTTARIRRLIFLWDPSRFFMGSVQVLVEYQSETDIVQAYWNQVGAEVCSFGGYQHDPCEVRSQDSD